MKTETAARGAVSVKLEERLEDKGVRARADSMFIINS